MARKQAGDAPAKTPAPRSDARREIDRFFKEEHAAIIHFTVREILDEQIVRKLA